MMSFLNSALLILISLSFSALNSYAKTSDKDLGVFQEIIQAQQRREKLYNNMHGVWEISESQSNGDSSKAVVEFWSRDGIYFRVDSLPALASEDARKGTRLIVRPEGYIRFLIDSSEDTGTIIAVGEAENGFPRITAHYFYGQANRALEGPVWEMLSNWIDGKSTYEKVELVKSTEGNVVVQVYDNQFKERGIFRDVTTITMEPERYTCIKAVREFSGSEGGNGTNTINYQYQADYPEIPSVASYVAIPDSDRQRERRTDDQIYTELSMEPAAMSVFDVDVSIFDRPSVGWSWSRRIFVLLVGVALMGVYFFWRRKTNG